jgi:Kinesin motor domain
MLFDSADRVFGQSESNRDVYIGAVQPLIEDVMSGYNGMCFAYGATASGKSETMMGTRGGNGVIPCAIDDIFDYKSKVSSGSTGSTQYRMQNVLTTDPPAVTQLRLD